jgi:hypothetical protein
MVSFMIFTASVRNILDSPRTSEKHYLSVTLSFAIQFSEAAVWECNSTSIEHEFTLDTHTHTHTHHDNESDVFYHRFPTGFKSLKTMTVLILLT